METNVPGIEVDGFEPVQIIILLVIYVCFVLGVWSRGVIAQDGRLSVSENTAFSLIGFVALVIPLGPTVYEALDPQKNNLFVMASAFVPPFFAGLTSRAEIKKLLKAASNA